MQLTKEHLEAKIAGLQAQLQKHQTDMETLRANCEALSGAIRMTQVLIAELEAPEPPREEADKSSKGRRLKLVDKPAASTTELTPAAEGEAT